MVGGFGRAEVFSFHATKVLTTFEGGAILTEDSELAERLRLMRNFGFAGYDLVVSWGVNAKMNEISAAMGICGLDCLDRFISANRRNYALYRERLSGIPGVRFYLHSESEPRNFHYVVLEIDEEKTGLSRDLLMKALHKENVLARRYFYPGCHRMEPYRSLYPGTSEGLKVTERLCEQVLVLPSGTAMEASDVSDVSGIIELCIANSMEISELVLRGSAGVSAV